MEVQDRGKVKYKEYSVEKVMSLKKIIAKWNGSKPKRYAILVDDEMVVEPTTDLGLFDTFLGFIEPHTTEVQVRLYFGSSPHHNKHSFRLPSHELSGIGQQLKSDDEKRLWELERDTVEQKRKIKKFKSAIQLLETENDSLREQVTDLSGKVDTKTIITESIEKFAPLLTGRAPQSPTQLQGANEPIGEVEIEGLDDEPQVSRIALAFDRLMIEYKVSNPKDVLKMNAIILKRKDLQEQIFNLIKQSK